jgi:hypothetical protein
MMGVHLRSRAKSVLTYKTTSGSGFQYHIIVDPRFAKEYAPLVRFDGMERPLTVFGRR